MTDRELLELAAKAVGYIDDATDDSEACGLHRNDDGVFYVVHPRGWHEWSPLEDRSDAFSLMVKLKMTVSVSCSINGGFAFVDVTAYHLFEHAEIEDKGPADQAEALTMRAITRCAAEVGRAMG